MKLTLDDINKATDEKYESLEIEDADGQTVKLRNPLRLPKFERDALLALAKDEESEGKKDKKDEEKDEEVDEAKTLARFKELLLIPADHKKVLEGIFEVWGDDLSIYMTVVDMYMKGVQAGEASPSQD